MNVWYGTPTFIEAWDSYETSRRREVPNSERVTNSADAELLNRFPPAPTFTRRILVERARLAIVDPAGEAEAIEPLTVGEAWSSVLERFVPLVPDVPDRERIKGDGSKPRAGARLCRRRDDRDLFERLVPADQQPRGRGKVLCPAHPDVTPSLSWRWTGERLLLHCWTGCSFREIVEAVR